MRYETIKNGNIKIDVKLVHIHIAKVSCKFVNNDISYVSRG